jgi:hypothetical protein
VVLGAQGKEEGCEQLGPEGDIIGTVPVEGSDDAGNVGQGHGRRADDLVGGAEKTLEAPKKELEGLAAG